MLGALESIPTLAKRPYLTADGSTPTPSQHVLRQTIGFFAGTTLIIQVDTEDCTGSMLVMGGGSNPVIGCGNTLSRATAGSSHILVMMLGAENGSLHMSAGKVLP